MSLFLKWMGGCVLLTLPFFYALHISFLEKSNMEAAVPVSFSKIETRVGEIADSVQRRFAARVHSQPIGSSFLASDPAHLPVRDKFIVDHFRPEGGHYLCTMIVDDLPRQCEIRGLKLEGPNFREVDETARAIGVTGRLEYSFLADAHRFSGYASWRDGAPPSLVTLSLIRQHKDWIIESGNFNLLKWRPSH